MNSLDVTQIIDEERKQLFNRMLGFVSFTVESGTLQKGSKEHEAILHIICTTFPEQAYKKGLVH